MLIGRVYVDGASHGNPGPAGIGIVILNSEGRVLREHREFIGVHLTNNQAEYMAIIRALDLCSSIFSSGVLHVFSDSELLIRQLNGIYKVRSLNLKSLFIEVKRREKLFTTVHYHHVSREHNKKANELANKAVEEGLKGLKLT